MSFWREFVEDFLFKDLCELMVVGRNNLRPMFFDLLLFFLNGDVGRDVGACANVSGFDDSAFGWTTIELDGGLLPIDGWVVMS